jgi:hypothetical protein
MGDGGVFDRPWSVLLTIHLRSWYHSPAKKPAKGWDLFFDFIGESYKRQRFSSK